MATGGVIEDEVNGTDTRPLEADEDELEIDWRDDGDAAEDAEPGDDQTTPAKRARADDDLYTGEENGKSTSMSLMLPFCLSSAPLFSVMSSSHTCSSTNLTYMHD